MKCNEEKCDSYNENEKNNCEQLRDINECEDIRWVEEKHKSPWKTTRPEKECLCVVILKSDKGIPAVLTRYFPEEDFFRLDIDGFIIREYKFKEIRCWIEYPQGVNQ